MEACVRPGWVEERAKALGFDLCGVVRPGNFPELAKMKEWLVRGYAGEMKYLSDGRRGNPAGAMPGVRSVIVCALNYNTKEPRSTEMPDGPEPRGWISRYAWGDDYHELLRGKLEELVVVLQEHFDKPFDARIYADTGPLHERVLAKYAGLGWLGKNTLLLNQNLGSWLFLGTILTTLDLVPSLQEPGIPSRDLCGSCRRCIDACPTDALIEPYVMDARRCISYLTIELRGSIPEEFRSEMGRHVFGCDICQDICPWNRHAPVTDEEEFRPRVFSAQHADDHTETPMQQHESSVKNSLFFPKLEWLASMDEEEYRDVFRGTAIKRTKWRGLVRNACIALGNSAPARGTPEHQRICALLQRLAVSPDVPISESALWALTRIQ